ncbi:MAG: CDP-diacylglycerol---glycerol-3-phosphate 3-phosphatidyltransferase [Actinomycetota bacterium]|jgi:CDP-diacylglycerol--glycerol-3-phosphate 3-phosphatidyltransferase|nr:CDP-diacylglycerol---glycerol-3-phosphate 3-phosphatidyltransferase [Actinomycetota bacterium]
MSPQPKPAAAGHPDPPRSGLDEDRCGHHGCVHESTENVLTYANGITLARTAGCLTAVTLSISTGRIWLLFAGLAIHCLGDMADGAVARFRDEETRAGAVLDIVSDRLCIAVYYLSYGHLVHAMLLPIALFLFQFMVLDAHLSLAFLNWPLRSLNYFYLVDRLLYAWNWSTPGKAFNSGALVVVMLITRSPIACTVLVLAIGTVKVLSLLRAHRVGIPAPVGCASAATS